MFSCLMVLAVTLSSQAHNKRQPIYSGQFVKQIALQEEPTAGFHPAGDGSGGGLLSGTPTQAGSYRFTIRVRDAGGDCTGDRLTLSMSIFLLPRAVLECST